ncbi:MAG: restriction endonuclease subunit S [Desulfurobacteriaceae bacterium]
MNEEIKVPEGWKVKKIKEIGKVITGKTPPTKISEYWDGSIPFITPSDIKGFDIRFNYTVERKVSHDWVERAKNLLLPEKSICFVSIGSTIGKMCMTKEPSFTNQQINSIIVNDEHNPFFIFYLLRYYQKNIHLKFTGGAAKGIINKTTFENIELPIPPLPEQQKIAEILGSIDDQIENLMEQNKTLEEIAKTIFKRWLIDFEFPNEEGKPYKSSGGEFVDSELGKIPKGWKIFRFKEIFSFVKGKKPKALENRYREGLLPYLSIEYLSGNTNNVQYALPENVIVSSDEDILMVMDGASSGKIFIGKKGIVSSTIAKINIINEIVGKDLLYFYLLHYEEKIKSHTTGSAIPHVDKKYVLNLKVALPLESYLSTKLNLIMKDFVLKILNNNKKIQTLTQLRDILLPKLITGEIRVKV